jgi:hypothetical protein
MTGKFLFPGYKPFTFEAFFYAYGNVGFGISGFPDNPIDVSLTLDLTNGTDTLTGIVESASNSWVSPLLCYREVTKLTLETTPATGKYMLDLPLGSATNNPQTNGYAAVSVSGLGNMAVSGALPDGAPFSQSVGVSKGGVWPLYAVPTGYKTNGMILGWETNQSSGNITGRPYWHKNTGVGAYYTTGVATNISSAGTNYLRPRAGNYSIVFQGGAISAPITNSLTVNNAGQFVVPRPAPADKLAISVSANGIIGGTVVIPGVTKPVQFKGGYFGASAGGSGFVLEGDGQTGTFSVQAQ